MRAFALVVAVSCLVACKPPPHATVLSCTNHPLSANAAESCTISVVHFEGATAAYPSTESRNQSVHVTGHIEIATGRVRVDIGGRKGVVMSATVAPGAPVSFDVDVPLDTSNQTFSITLTPMGGAPAGLSGTIEHHAI